MGAAVFLDGYRSQHGPCVGLVRHANARVIGCRSRFGQHLDHPQRRDPRPRRPGEVTVVDVQQRDGGGRIRIGRALPGSQRLHRLIRHYGRLLPGTHRNRIDAGNLLVPIDQLLVAKSVDPVDAVVASRRIVGAEVIIFAQRPRRPVHHVVGDGRRLRLGEGHLRRQSLQLRHRQIIFSLGVNEHQRAERVTVMCAGRGHELLRVGDGPDAHLHPRPSLALFRIVAMKAAWVAAVGITGPDVMRDVRIPIDVVPSSVYQHAVVRDARLPFVRFVKAQPNHVAPVRLHGMQSRTRDNAGRSAGIRRVFRK